VVDLWFGFVFLWCVRQDVGLAWSHFPWYSMSVFIQVQGEHLHQSTVWHPSSQGKEVGCLLWRWTGCGCCSVPRCYPSHVTPIGSLSSSSSSGLLIAEEDHDVSSCLLMFHLLLCL
jgi:hypothetical protein